MLGVGGGIILVPMLVFLFNLEMHQAIGTSLVIIIPTVLVGAYAHHSMGNVNLGVAAVIIVGSVVGAWFGAHFAESIQTDHLKKIFGLVLLLVSLKMIFGR